jgi:hypothetical protein
MINQEKCYIQQDPDGDKRNNHGPPKGAGDRRQRSTSPTGTRETAIKTVIVPARQLKITDIEDADCWKWKDLQDPRYVINEYQLSLRSEFL